MHENRGSSSFCPHLFMAGGIPSPLFSSPAYQSNPLIFNLCDAVPLLGNSPPPNAYPSTPCTRNMFYYPTITKPSSRCQGPIAWLLRHPMANECRRSMVSNLCRLKSCCKMLLPSAGKRLGSGINGGPAMTPGRGNARLKDPPSQRGFDGFLGRRGTDNRDGFFVENLATWNRPEAGQVLMG